MTETPTLQDFVNDPPSVRNLRDELSRETRATLQETRRALETMNGRMTAMETEMRHLSALSVLLEEIKTRQHAEELFRLELEQWREHVAGPIAAASKLDAATHGARMAVVGVFTLATCILAVAGVIQLIGNTWARLSQ